jgi:AraC-like DNA-binding protein
VSYQREKLVELTVELLRHQPRLTVAETADMLQVHRHTLQRALKFSGCSFALIRHEFILERFERHSAGGSSSLKQLWTELGFSSSSAFARYIRHATGKSPSELRANNNLGHSARKRSTTTLDPHAQGK